MRNTILILLMIASFALISCKKTADPTPITNTITVHDTVKTKVNVTTTVHDTVAVMPLSEIIQGTWYCYKAVSSGGITNTANITVIFTATSLNWGSNPTATISFSTDYKTIYTYSSQLDYKVSLFNLTELVLLDTGGANWYLRRNP